MQAELQARKEALSESTHGLVAQIAARQAQRTPGWEVFVKILSDVLDKLDG